MSARKDSTRVIFEVSLLNILRDLKSDAETLMPGF